MRDQWDFCQDCRKPVRSWPRVWFVSEPCEECGSRSLNWRVLFDVWAWAVYRLSARCECPQEPPYEPQLLSSPMRDSVEAMVADHGKAVASVAKMLSEPSFDPMIHSTRKPKTIQFRRMP